MNNYDEAPPPDDWDAPLPPPSAIAPDPLCEALRKLTIQVGALVDAVLVLTASQTPSVAPGVAAGPPPQAGPPTGSSGPPAGTDSSQIKRGKAIYAICMNNDRKDIAAVGEAVTGHRMDKNSQKWSEADQAAVLDAMKEWGWNNR